MSVYREPEEDLTMPVPKEEMVVEPLLATVKREVPEEEATTKGLMLGYVLVPWTVRVAIGLEVPMPTLWLAVAVRMEIPVELDTLKMLLVEPDVPWMLKVTVEEVALTPATVPLSMIKPWAKVLLPFHLERKPTLPEPIELK